MFLPSAIQLLTHLEMGLSELIVSQGTGKNVPCQPRYQVSDSAALSTSAA
jgi:hypothetical protein